MKIIKNKSGFTLVELMVVVAIIGILSAVAVPNFKKYQAKSKTAEAKLHLAAIYTAQQAFSSDYDTYGTCLKDMGYDPTPEAAQRYYATGFTSAAVASVTSIATGNGAACTSAAGTMNFVGTKKLGSLTAATVAAIYGSGTVADFTADETSFIAGAAGFVHGSYSTDATSDQWSINESKFLKHELTGY